MGVIDTLSVPRRHVFGQLAPGKHRVTLRIDNRPLYQATVGLKCAGGSDTRTDRFGFRGFKDQGTRFTINGKPCCCAAWSTMPNSRPPEIRRLLSKGSKMSW